MGGYCDAKAGKDEYQGVCQGLGQSNCNVQIVCEWKTAHCVAKPGHESSFKLLCENVDSKSNCDLQMFCQWKGGGAMPGAGAQFGGAGGYCDAKAGKDEYKGICQGIGQSNCNVQIVCEWKTAHCVAKPGHESSFKLLCENVDSKSNCDLQMFCQWKSS